MLKKKSSFHFVFICAVLIYPSVSKSSIRTVEPNESYAWYIMRQINAGPLLLGLTPKMGKVIETTKRSDSIWTGIEDGGTLKINITLDELILGEIFIGFFKDLEWSSMPLQIRSFPAVGEYTIENFPPGEYQIGAMIGSLPSAKALGVQQQWPQPVKIEKGKTNIVKVLVSGDIQKRASGYDYETEKDFIANWNHTDKKDLLHGRVTGPNNEPVKFATVQIREHNPGASSIAAPDCGTNEHGYYRYDGIEWPYTVGVIRYKPLPSLFGYCHQYLMYNHVFDECEMVNFKFDDFPGGSASVKGRLLDDNGNPVKECFVDIRTKMDWDVRDNPDDKYYSVTGYRVPFVSEDGSFEFNNLSEGDYRAHIIPFDMQSYEFGNEHVFTLESDKIKNINLTIVAKNVLYGRVLFTDGSPAIIKPDPWLEARTMIMVSGGSMFSSSTSLVDSEGYFSVKFSNRELEQFKSGAGQIIINVPTDKNQKLENMGDFPIDLLAKDKSKAGTVKISKPEFEPRSIKGKSLPSLNDFEIDMKQIQIINKNVLICFFDLEQRPSRNCILELNKKSADLKERDIEVILIHASKIEKETLDNWFREYNVELPFGMIDTNDPSTLLGTDEKQITNNWGVKALPWLILTDEKHVIKEEGFSISELDEKI